MTFMMMPSLFGAAPQRQRAPCQAAGLFEDDDLPLPDDEEQYSSEEQPSLDTAVRSGLSSLFSGFADAVAPRSRSRRESTKTQRRQQQLQRQAREEEARQAREYQRHLQRQAAAEQREQRRREYLLAQQMAAEEQELRQQQQEQQQRRRRHAHEQELLRRRQQLRQQQQQQHEEQAARAQRWADLQQQQSAAKQAAPVSDSARSRKGSVAPVPTPQPQDSVFVSSSVPTERGTTTFSVTLEIPAKRQSLPLTVLDNCTVEGLHRQAELPPATRFIFRGKMLSANPKAELKSFGVKDGSTIMVALLAVDPEQGDDATYSHPTAVQLLEIARHFEELNAPVTQAGSVKLLEPLQRKMFFEDSMKLLYRLDALEDLPSALRQQRKDLVRGIQTLQDEAQEGL